LTQAVAASVLVGFANDSRRGVADAEVNDLALFAYGVQAEHELGDAGCEVPPVNVEDVDVGRLELLQGSLDAKTEALGAVAAIVGVDGCAVVA